MFKTYFDFKKGKQFKMKIINNLQDVENISKNIKNKDNEKCQKCIKKQENIIKDNKTNEKYIQSQNKEEFNNLNYDNTGISTFNIEKLKKQDEAKTRIMKFITYKKRTEQEIRNKFKNEIQEEILEEVIEYLKQAKYIDDDDFVHKKINEFMKLKTMSIKEIKYKLIEKGINKKLIEKYIENNREELEEYEKKCIEKIKIKKSNNMDEDKINQYLYRKGFNISKYNN